MRRLNIRPDALRERLQKEDIPVSKQDRKRPKPLEGGPPSIRLNLRPRSGAFERIPQLDRLSARVKQIEDECLGSIQKLYRNPDITEQQRERRIRELAENRRGDIQRAIEDQLMAVKLDLRPLKVSKSRLSSEQLDKRETMEAAQEAIKLYALYVFGIEV
jgi:hypothetical protein